MMRLMVDMDWIREPGEERGGGGGGGGGGSYDTYQRSQRRGHLVAHKSAPDLPGTFIFSFSPLLLSIVVACRGLCDERGGWSMSK